MITGKKSNAGRKEITEDTPLTAQDWKFILAYINAEAGINDNIIGIASSDKIRTAQGYRNFACRMLKKPNIRKEINRLMEERAKKAIADGNEVMEYFSKVMRNEEKDQFGLDASLADRTNAAKELAKRTIDVDLRKQGLADNKLEITIDWGQGNDTIPDTGINLYEGGNFNE